MSVRHGWAAACVLASLCTSAAAPAQGGAGFAPAELAVVKALREA